jgi:hypothetical protein
MKYDEWFMNGHHISFHRIDTFLGEDGAGGTWFHWFCDCEPSTIEHKYRSPQQASDEATAHGSKRR